MTDQDDLNKLKLKNTIHLKLKLKNTIHYKDEGKTLFIKYLKSLIPNKQKDLIDLFFIDYQPVSRSISFRLGINSLSDFSITANIFFKNKILKFNFEEYNKKYSLKELSYKKILIDTLHYISHNIKNEKIENILDTISNYKKNYLSLQREVKNATEQFFTEQFKRYEKAVKSYFSVKGIEKAENEINLLIQEAEEILNTKYKHHDFQKNGIYNIFRDKPTFFYFEFINGMLYIKKSELDFNITKDKKINYKLDNNLTSRKKFLNALSNQIYFDGEYIDSAEKIWNISHIKNFMKNRYNLECDLKEFAKPLLLNTIAKNF